MILQGFGKMQFRFETVTRNPYKHMMGHPNFIV